LITSRLYQQLAATNLCPAPNGSGRFLHLISSSELWVNLPHCHSLAREVHKGSYVTRVNLWACLFHGCHVKNLTQGPGYSGKSGTLFFKGLWSLVYESSPLCLIKVLSNSCVKTLVSLLTTQVEKREDPPTLRRSLPSTAGRATFRFGPNAEMDGWKSFFDSSRGRCRGLLLCSPPHPTPRA
jgi:hypothetical protein